MPSTASEWLAERPENVEALSEMLAGVQDFPIRLWTEMPLWMKEEVASQLTETFQEAYWEKIAATTAGDAERVLRAGLEDGWSIRRMATEMRDSLGGDQYARNRANNIARTESGHALNGARKAASDRLKADLPPLGIKRVWMSVLGNTTRDTHADLDGVPEDSEGLWELSGIKIPWPSHTKLPPEERCNCQCTTFDEFGMSEQEAQELIDLSYNRAAEGKSADDLFEKHLPGKHDQLTHGHAHAVGSAGIDTSKWPKHGTAANYKSKLENLEHAAYHGDMKSVVTAATLDQITPLKTEYAKEYVKGAKNLWQQKIDEDIMKPVPDGLETAKGTGGIAADSSGWKKTGPQLGSNYGGKFEAPDGKEYYVKYPDNNNVARNEVLANKLYAATGATVPNAFLVKGEDGMLGVATEWDSGAKKFTKAHSNKIIAKQDFATHAWAANWDCVGQNTDNIVVTKLSDGSKAVSTIDVGGSLQYRAQGEPKPPGTFGKKVQEWDSLRDAGINPQSADVFDGVTDAQMQSSARRVTSLSDSNIKKLSGRYLGKQEGEKVAGTLIARKKDIAARAEALKTGKTKAGTTKVTTPTGKKTTAKVKAGAIPGPPKTSSKDIYTKKKLDKMHELASQGKWDELEAIPTSAKHKGGPQKKKHAYKTQLLQAKTSGATIQPAKHTTSAKPKKINPKSLPGTPKFEDSKYASQNTATANDALNLAKKGDLDGLKAMKIPPSPKLKEYHESLMADVALQQNLPPAAKAVSGSLTNIAASAKVVKMSEGAPKLGKYLVIGEATEIPSNATIKGEWNREGDKKLWGKGATAYSQLTTAQQKSITLYTASGYKKMNKELRAGKKLGLSTRRAADGVTKASIPIPQGTRLRRRHDLSPAMIGQLQKSKGKVLQDPGIMSCTTNPNAWHGVVGLDLTVGPGVKALPADKFSAHKGEFEYLLPPNTRVLVNGVTTKKFGGQITSVEVEATILPFQEGQCCPP